MEVSPRCRRYADEVSRLGLVRVVSVYQPNEDTCVVDFVDRQFPGRVVREHAYGHYLSSIAVDLKRGFVSFNLNKFVPESRDVVELYLPERVCGPRVHVVFEPGSKRIGVQGAVDSFSDARQLIEQYFQPL